MARNAATQHGLQCCARGLQQLRANGVIKTAIACTEARQSRLAARYYRDCDKHKIEVRPQQQQRERTTQTCASFKVMFLQSSKIRGI